MKAIRRGFTVVCALLTLAVSVSAENKFKADLGDNLSDDFRRNLDKTIAYFPEKFQAWLEDKEVKLVTGNCITDMRPDLKGMTPRGYPQGSTWDMSEGLHDRGTVYLPEFKRFQTRNGEKAEPIELSRVSEVLHHELGHAVDFNGGYSESAVFVGIFEREKAAFLAKRTQIDNSECLAYFLTPGVGGRKETFAELFSAVYNPQPSPEAQLLKLHFPETFALVKGIATGLHD